MAIALVLLVGTYGLFEAQTLIRGPILTVTAPTPGELVANTFLTITGVAKNSTRVLVNGRPVTQDFSGAFSQKLITTNGYGVVLVEAQNRFGRTTTRRIEYVGTPQASH